LGRRSSERQQPAATLLVIRLPRQSKSSSIKRLTSGSLAVNVDAAELSRMVIVSIVFFSHARAASKSRFWACLRIWRKRVRVARSCVLVSDPGSACWEMLVTKRLRIGRACGTTVAWHEPVPRMLANMWRMQACRSVLIMEGKTWAASTRADKAVVSRATASSLSSWRAKSVSAVELDVK